MVQVQQNFESVWCYQNFSIRQICQFHLHNKILQERILTAESEKVKLKSFPCFAGFISLQWK